MFRGFGLQSAAGCSEARGPTHTAAQTSNASRDTDLHGFPLMFRVLSCRPSSRGVRWTAVDNSTGTASTQQQKSIIYCCAQLARLIN